jgi:DNA-nicking Smr family endonuclease
VAEDDEPFELPIGEELDLHAFAPRDVVSVVEEYLLACWQRGLCYVRIVHGRGKGVQRAEVRRLLGRLEYVLDFDDAPPLSGGWGATLVHLAPSAKS